MSCLDNLVSLGLCPDDGASESGLTLMQADGISVKNLANITDDKNASGIELAMQKKTLSIIQVQNDFIAALHANRVMTNMSEAPISAANFVTSGNVGLYSGYRGLTLHRVHRKGTLRKLIIDAVELYPLTSGTITLRIDDGFNVYSYSGIAVTANQVNVLDADVVDNFPMTVNDASNEVKITVEQSSVTFAQSSITCLKGCNGSVPNDCGWVDGWSGTGAIKGEGYGVNVVFHCACDYAQILCNMPKQFIGELIWLKWQINIFKEQLKSNRFNNWVVYQSEKINEIVLPELINEYNGKWEAIMQGIPDLLKRYNDSCLNCRGLRWQVTL